jgi:YesN/AraC family two-component response regulator
MNLVGETPLAYLTKWRMNYAGYLKKKQISVREIADRVGYFGNQEKPRP